MQTDRDRLINLARPFASSCACKEESGSCEFVDCKICNAACIADTIIEDGWIRPPCKVGDKVYIIAGVSQQIVESIVIGMWIRDGNFSILTIHGNIFDDSLGKTVFLTREEAERALKEREKE